MLRAKRVHAARDIVASYIELHGVTYYIPWQDMRVGNSIFLLTIATPAQVRAALRAIGIPSRSVLVCARVEFGHAGVRVWRL